MKKNGKRHSQEEIIMILQEVGSTGNAASAARGKGISVKNICRVRMTGRPGLAYIERNGRMSHPDGDESHSETAS